MPASGLYQHENADEPDIMSWFPRREDYEDKPAFVPDESYEEKIQRLKIWMNKFSLVHVKPDFSWKATLFDIVSMCFLTGLYLSSITV